MLVYRIILILAAPFVTVWFLLRWMIGKETPDGLGERLGLRSVTGQNGPVIWVHGASLGEMTAARPLIEALIVEIKNLRVAVTVNTYTAREMVIGWANPAISVQMAPLDYSGSLRRFLRNWKPAAALILENEIWPQRIQTSRALQIPVLVVGGRMSERTALRWAWFQKFAAEVMAGIAYLAPLNSANADRFLQLGLAPDRIGPPIVLKSAVKLSPPDPLELAGLQKTFYRDSTFLAASTHEEDDDFILTAFKTALGNDRNLKLILAPRHPHRGDEVARLIEQHGLSYSRRSKGYDPDAHYDVLLADTIGEMPLWYSMAKATIICGTFGTRGGHTPVEPVQFSSYVIHGPDIANHTEAFAVLHGANAATLVTDRSKLIEIFEGSGVGPDDTATSQRATEAIQKLCARQADAAYIVKMVKTISET